jgi:hypothetical protein
MKKRCEPPMIDFVKLKYEIEIPEKCFSKGWKKRLINNYEPFFFRKVNGVYFSYLPDRRMFHINGKILLLLHNTRVLNFDDIYGSDRESFLDEINAAINGLFSHPIQGLDIRNFTVTHIDFCINVTTPYVKEYIDFLTQAFEKTNHGERVNYTKEKQTYGSVYIKTTAQYEKNEKRNYTVNFYDKSDWVQNKLLEGSNISTQDQILADQLLRLELQAGNQQVKKIAAECNIGNTFAEFFNFDVAYKTILRLYNLVFKANEEADSYSHERAKKAVDGIEGLQTKSKESALKTLKDVSQNHHVTRSRRDRIRDLGIYPWCFLDKRGDLTYLENPIKLIRKKFLDLGVFEAEDRE